jgi:hypothetical protein
MRIDKSILNSILSKFCNDDYEIIFTMNEETFSHYIYKNFNLQKNKINYEKKQSTNEKSNVGFQ